MAICCDSRKGVDQRHDRTGLDRGYDVNWLIDTLVTPKRTCPNRSYCDIGASVHGRGHALRLEGVGSLLLTNECECSRRSIVWIWAIPSVVNRPPGFRVTASMRTRRLKIGSRLERPDRLRGCKRKQESFADRYSFPSVTQPIDGTLIFSVLGFESVLPSASRSMSPRADLKVVLKVPSG